MWWYYNKGDESNIEKFTYKEYTKYIKIFEEEWELTERRQKTISTCSVSDQIEEYTVQSLQEKYEVKKQKNDKIFL